MALNLQQFKELYGEQPKLTEIIPVVESVKPTVRDHITTGLYLLLFFIIGYLITTPLYIGIYGGLYK